MQNICAFPNGNKTLVYKKKSDAAINFDFKVLLFLYRVLVIKKIDITKCYAKLNFGIKSIQVYRSLLWV